MYGKNQGDYDSAIQTGNMRKQQAASTPPVSNEIYVEHDNLIERGVLRSD